MEVTLSKNFTTLKGYRARPVNVCAYPRSAGQRSPERCFSQASFRKLVFHEYVSPAIHWRGGGRGGTERNNERGRKRDLLTVFKNRSSGAAMRNNLSYLRNSPFSDASRTSAVDSAGMNFRSALIGSTENRWHFVYRNDADVYRRD